MVHSISRIALGSLRIGVGAITLIAPGFAARLFGLDTTTSPWVTRLFGSRELALAVALLGAQDAAVPVVAGIGAAVDSADCVSSVAEFARGKLSVYTLVSGGGGAALFAILGLIARRDAVKR
ncbi:hypothetical protein PDG61_11375 [Mycolicibacterium sp. BiH015]|uniref:hypothetical protein n=1 Tax=Mycolicibacterium sp. BiH015 TaxID=3018808 RepID=UPI0022E38CB6|nr:hypothetical protein [Mycolicibacterium sp. BiH015]MDA2891513.1 hypothetical protein [Mycolicibacterium sp. BiH015]